MNEWTNYETKLYFTWLMNDESRYTATMEKLKNNRETLADELKRIYLDGIPADLDPLYWDYLITCSHLINYKEIAQALIDD